MALLIVADLGSLGEAADQLGNAAGATRPVSNVPSLGDPGADGALGDLTSALQLHANRLAEAAGHGARSMRGYIVGYRQVGG